jgi:hypothetical protein
MSTQPGDGAPSAWSAPRPWARQTGALWDRLLGPTPEELVPAGRPIPSYFWVSLLSLVLFPFTGVIAVGYSLLVTHRSQRGERELAARASRQARVWCVASMAVFAVIAIAVVLSSLAH